MDKRTPGEALYRRAAVKQEWLLQWEQLDGATKLKWEEQAVREDTQTRETVTIEVLKERERQDLKWGIQDHYHPTWLAILMEEIGEASKAYLQSTHEGASEKEDEIRGELIQAAAVIFAWIECIDRADAY